jgi:hypothetical protein
MHLSRCYQTRVSSTSCRSCPMTIIMTTSDPQTPHGHPLIESLHECIPLNAIEHVELHLESLVYRRLCRGTSTLDVDVPYLPWCVSHFMWRQIQPDAY